MSETQMVTVKQEEDMSWMDYLDTAALLGTFIPGLGALKGIKVLRGVLGVKQAIDGASFLGDKTGWVHIPNAIDMGKAALQKVRATFTDQVVGKGLERLSELEPAAREELIKTYGSPEAAEKAIQSVSQQLYNTVPLVVAAGAVLVLAQMRHSARLVVAPRLVSVQDMYDAMIVPQIMARANSQFIVGVYARVSEILVMRDLRRTGTSMLAGDTPWDARGPEMLATLAGLTNKDLDVMFQPNTFVITRLAALAGGH